MARLIKKEVRKFLQRIAYIVIALLIIFTIVMSFAIQIMRT